MQNGNGYDKEMSTEEDGHDGSVRQVAQETRYLVSIPGQYLPKVSL